VFKTRVKADLVLGLEAKLFPGLKYFIQFAGWRRSLRKALQFFLILWLEFSQIFKISSFFFLFSLPSRFTKFPNLVK